MRRAPTALVGLVIIVSAVFAATAPAPASGQSPSDVLLDDAGPGWATIGCDVPAPPGSATVCFDATSRDGFLQITATPTAVGPDVRTIVDQLAAGYAPSPTFETPGLDAAKGFTLSAAGNTTSALVVAGQHHVFNLGLILDDSPPVAAAFLIEIGVRQQQRDGGPPPIAGPPVDRHDKGELEPLLVSLPASSGFVEADTTTQRQNYDDLRPRARNQRVIDLLNDHLIATRIFQSGGNAFIVVSLAKHPYDEFAAIELGAFKAARGLANVHPLAGVTDGIAFESGDQLGAAFRRGPYSVTVLAAVPATSPADVARVVSRVAILQAARLPSGPTGPYSFPPLAESLVLALAVTTVACVAAAGASRLGAARRRRAVEAQPATARRLSTPGYEIDVENRAAALRRRGYLLFVVQVVAVDALVIGVLVVLGVIDVPRSFGVALAGLGLVGGMGFTAIAARRELAAFGGAGAPRRGRWRSPLSLVSGLVALALLVGGLIVAAGGLADLLFGPSIGGLERAAALHVAPGRLSTVTLGTGLVLLVLGGIVVRLARMWSRATAKRLRQLDRRPPVLYLRSFDDDALPLPTVLSARRPFLELFLTRGADPFEEALAWELTPYGPVVAIGRPGRSLASLGAARDHLADDEWRGGVAERMAEARAIVMAIGSTAGVHWEIGALVAKGHLTKTIFLFPPTDATTHQRRWRFIVGALRDAGTVVPPLPGEPDRALTAALDRRGQWHVVTATTRDEATYRVAIDVTMNGFERGWAVSDDRARSPAGIIT